MGGGSGCGVSFSSRTRALRWTSAEIPLLARRVIARVGACSLASTDMPKISRPRTSAFSAFEPSMREGD
jgi:hypothetical protein